MLKQILEWLRRDFSRPTVGLATKMEKLTYLPGRILLDLRLDPATQDKFEKAWREIKTARAKSRRSELVSYEHTLTVLLNEHNAVLARIENDHDVALRALFAEHGRMGANPSLLLSDVAA